MSNKTQLQTNNLTLDSYITRINEVKEVAAGLPDAGGGGGIGSTARVIFASDSGVFFDYIDASGVLCNETEVDDRTCDLLAPSIVVAKGVASTYVVSAGVGCTLLSHVDDVAIFHVSGDGSIMTSRQGGSQGGGGN